MLNENDIKKMLLKVAVAPPAENWIKVAAALDELEADTVLHDQLLSAEVYPPAGIWQQLSRRFDDEQLNETYATRLNNTSVTPPAVIWENIAQQLNDDAIANQLSNTAITPPMLAWDVISKQLDEESDKLLREKILKAEATPPVTCWDFIEQQLGAESGAKVISIGIRLKTVYKLAAAAAVTGIIAWSAYQFLASPTADPQPAIVQNNTPQPQPAIAPAIVKKVEKESAPNTSTSKNKVTAYNRKPAVAKTKPVIRKEQTEPLNINNNIAAIETTPANHSSQALVSYTGIHHNKKTGNTGSQAITENRYLLVLNENGDLIRVSKKLATLKCAKTGDFPTDAVAVLQSRDCENQIKEWQQRLSISTSSAGYIDLDELVKTTEK